MYRMSYPRRIASDIATLGPYRTVVLRRSKACHTRRVSQLLVRYECGIAFGV